jgi:anti-sigma28 factor (negative regulator of flagellin synthesis)
MSLDRIQPRNAINPLWEKENSAAVKKDGSAPAASAAQAPSAKTSAKPGVGPAAAKNSAQAAPKTQAPRRNIWGTISQDSISRLHSVSQKIQAVGTQSQLNQQISAVGQDIVVTQQELSQASRTTDEPGGAGGGNGSYWDKLSVTEKARTINQLKDKLQKMEVQQSQLQNQLAEEINSGTYAVSGEEVVNGMLTSS